MPGSSRLFHLLYFISNLSNNRTYCCACCGLPHTTHSALSSSSVPFLCPMWPVRPRIAVTSCRWSSSHSLLASSRDASNTTTIYGNRQIGRLSSPPGSLLPRSARRCHHHHHHYQPSLARASPPFTASRTSVVAVKGGRWNTTCSGARHRKRSLSSQAPSPTTAAAAAGHCKGAVASPSTGSSSVDAAGSLRTVDRAALLRRMATYIEEDAGAADKLGHAVSTGLSV